MIDNFDTIRNLLTFPNENSFYFLEILKRRKENPEMTKHASVVKDFYIYSLEEFDNLRGKIVDLCNEHNARAYFRLNVRDAEKTALQTLKRIAELLVNGNHKAVKDVYPHVVGEFHHDPNKTWVIDLDGEGEDLHHMVTDVVLAIDKITGDPDTVMAKLQTKNGVHLITRPFRLDVFKGEFPTVDVHKDNPTILYMP